MFDNIKTVLLGYINYSFVTALNLYIVVVKAAFYSVLT